MITAGHEVSREPIVTTTQPDGTVSVVDLSTPGAYQDLAFEATHADGRCDRFAAYHTGERAIFTDVLTRLAAGRSTEAVLADIARIRDAVNASTSGLSPTCSQSRLRPIWQPAPAEPTLPFSNSCTIDGRSRRVGLTVTGNTCGLRFSERRGPERGLKVVIAADELWRFAAGMMWRSYEGSALLSRVCTDEYQDALGLFESLIRQPP